MDLKTIGVIFVMFIGFVVLMNKFSPKAAGQNGESKGGKLWILAVVIIAGCLWYISK